MAEQPNFNTGYKPVTVLRFHSSDARRMFRKSRNADELTFVPDETLEVRETLTKGLGLFTLTMIEKVSSIILYLGSAKTNPEWEEATKMYLEQFLTMNYGSGLSGGRVIDATVFGNKARFINSSHQGNCRVGSVTIAGVENLHVYADLDIPAETELSYDYGTYANLSDEPVVCFCAISGVCTGVFGVKTEMVITKFRNQHDGFQQIRESMRTREEHLVKDMKRIF